MERTNGGSGVQSVDRSLLLLELLADAGGSLRLAELEALTGLPLPTVHRLVRSLVHNGYVRQDASRRYALGARLIRLGEIAARGLGAGAMPQLRQLADRVGETANMALLDGDDVVYIAQVPSVHSMRMFTVVGRRVSPHCTGVGKALLSQLPVEDAAALLGRTGMTPQTPQTLTDPDALIEQLALIRERGWAVDAGEQELGVWCVAAPVVGAPAPVAISVSGPSGRVTEERVEEIAPTLCAVAVEVGRVLAGPSPIH